MDDPTRLTSVTHHTARHGCTTAWPRPATNGRSLAGRRIDAAPLAKALPRKTMSRQFCSTVPFGRGPSKSGTLTKGREGGVGGRPWLPGRKHGAIDSGPRTFACGTLPERFLYLSPVPHFSCSSSGWLGLGGEVTVDHVEQKDSQEQQVPPRSGPRLHFLLRGIPPCTLPACLRGSTFDFS